MNYGKYIVTAILVLVGSSLNAQKLSIDLATVRNQTARLHGANASVFYHFTEKFSGGIEVNRFFTTQKTKQEGTVFKSAWDYDINFHYYLPLSKQIIFYPVAGFSYSIEKEKDEIKEEKSHSKYVNSGAGVLFNTKGVKPHFEYVLANGRKTEHFLVAGITIELTMEK